MGRAPARTSGRPPGRRRTRRAAPPDGLQTWWSTSEKTSSQVAVVRVLNGWVVESVSPPGTRSSRPRSTTSSRPGRRARSRRERAARPSPGRRFYGWRPVRARRRHATTAPAAITATTTTPGYSSPSALGASVQGWRARRIETRPDRAHVRAVEGDLADTARQAERGLAPRVACKQWRQRQRREAERACDREQIRRVRTNHSTQQPARTEKKSRKYPVVSPLNSQAAASSARSRRRCRSRYRCSESARASSRTRVSADGESARCDRG